MGKVSAAEKYISEKRKKQRKKTKIDEVSMSCRFQRQGRVKCLKKPCAIASLILSFRRFSIFFSSPLVPLHLYSLDYSQRFNTLFFCPKRQKELQKSEIYQCWFTPKRDLDQRTVLRMVQRSKFELIIYK
jgi:hypothetical protein